MTKTEIRNLIALTTANFPGMQEKDMRPTAVLWEKMLADIPYKSAEKAIVKIIATAKYFPTVAEIRETVDKFNPNSLPEPDEAWAEVMQQISSAGCYGKPRWSHQAVQDAVRAIGWNNICLSTNIGVERKHFMDIYKAVQGRYKDKQINEQVLRLTAKIGLLPE